MEKGVLEKITSGGCQLQHSACETHSHATNTELTRIRAHLTTNLCPSCPFQKPQGLPPTKSWQQLATTLQ